MLQMLQVFSYLFIHFESPKGKVLEKNFLFTINTPSRLIQEHLLAKNA